MKTQLPSALKKLILAIIVLALVATLAGLWPAANSPYPLITFRGEQVIINARGLYYWETVSSAAQMQAKDLVALAGAARLTARAAAAGRHAGLHPLHLHLPDRPVAALKARVWVRQGRLTEALAWVREQGLSPARVLQTLALDGDQDGLRRPAFG